MPRDPRPPRRPRGRWWPLVATPVLMLALAACGSTSPGGGGTPPPGGSDPVAASLKSLGVDTSQTDRVSPTGSTLGKDDAPLGGSANYGNAAAFSNESSANPTMELLVARDAGSSSAGSTLSVEKITGAQVTTGGSIDFGSETNLADLTSGNDWITPAYGEGNQFQTLRATAAGDFDGDGLDEIASLYVDQADGVLKLRVFDDSAHSFAATTDSLAPGTDVKGVALHALDANGDGTYGLVAAVSYADHVDLTPIAKDASGHYALDDASTVTLPQKSAGSMLYVRMASGNIDYDNGQELAVVVNEAFGSSGSLSGLATYYVFDDANHGRAQLASGSVQAAVPNVVAAAASDVSIADIDGDGLGEIVLGGATNLAWQCGNNFGAVLYALDDNAHGLKQLGATLGTLSYPNCPNYASWHRYFVFITTPDLNGDGIHEITANQLVYGDFKNNAPFTLLPDMQLDPSLFLQSSQDTNQYLSLAETDVVAADVTGDGRENVLVYQQNRTTIPVWGLSAISSIGAAANGWAQLSELTGFTTHNGQTTSRPILLPANVESDGPALKYSAGSHQLVFTEPIVIAALAAPPCSKSIGQNWSACVTSFGQGSSTTVDSTVTLTVKAGVVVGVEAGVNVPFVGNVGVNVKQSVTATAKAWAGSSYTVEKTVTYSTGALEDGVVFTSIPYDVYRYTILSDPDPTMVGKIIVVRIPREPVTMIAERGFYNASIPSTGLHIDSRVFQHAVGDIGSYPSASDKAGLLSQYGGLEFGPKGVGQGTGSTQQQISVSNSVSQGQSLGLEYQMDVEATAGEVMAGFTVGYGLDAAFTVTSGSKTTYTGTVGSIDAADYQANAYQWGIFTYVQPLQGQKFEVIDYWVQ